MCIVIKTFVLGFLYGRVQRIQRGARRGKFQ